MSKVQAGKKKNIDEKPTCSKELWNTDVSARRIPTDTDQVSLHERAERLWLRFSRWPQLLSEEHNRKMP